MIYNKDEIDENCVKIAFDAAQKLQMPSVAFDFLHDKNGNPIITEISYGRDNKNKGHTGYWTNDMQWHESNNINICDWIIEDLIKKTSML